MAIIQPTEVFKEKNFLGDKMPPAHLEFLAKIVMIIQGQECYEEMFPRSSPLFLFLLDQFVNPHLSTKGQVYLMETGRRI